MIADIQAAGEVRLADMDREVLRLAHRLRQKHGDVLVAHEKKGTHLYMASPKCLDMYGAIELQKRHLAVNADKFLCTGMYRRLRGTYAPDRSAVCMKTGQAYGVQQLLDMPTLKERGFGDGASSVQVTLPPAYDTANDGTLLPKPPGDCVDLEDLPPGHACLEFIRTRKLNLRKLKEVARAQYCVAEFPESEESRIFYKRLTGGWKDTPQGRLILYCDIQGNPVGWQARILTRDVGNERLHFHPYDNRWVVTHTREHEEAKWELVEDLAPVKSEFTGKTKSWDPSKYRTARGAFRNSLLMGLDAALAWNLRQGIAKKNRVVVITEGPLDAVRMGSPAVALLGKHFSPQQAALVLKHFGVVALLGDNDKAGNKMLESAAKLLTGRCRLETFKTPGKAGSDPGELPELVADAFMDHILKELA